MTNEAPEAAPATATTAADETAMRFAVADMRLEAEALILEQGILSWKNRVYGDEIDITRTYEGHETLFGRDAIRTVEAAIAAAPDAREQKALRYFRRYLLAESIGKAVAPLDDRIANGEAAAEISFDGRTAPYRQSFLLLAREEDYDLRKRISDAQLPVLRRFNPVRAEKEERARALARGLGFASYNALGEELRSFDLERLARDCERLLASTEAAYAALLREVVPEFMGLPVGRFRRCDVFRLFHLDRYAACFPPERLGPAVAATLRGLGIDLAAQANIWIHDLPLPKKNPRAACYALKVPGHVRLTVKPTGGAGDWETFLHEMGHAQHFAWTENDIFEFRQLGDNTVTETYAFLFEDLMDDPSWVREHAGIPPEETGSYLRFRRFSKMYMARRYAAKLLYERRLHAGADDPRDLYRRTLSRAYGFPLDEEDAERYLSDVDDFYYVADYLRAWFLKAQLERSLVARFGAAWYRNPKAGAFLRSLWRHGQELNGDELARLIGDERLDPGTFIGILAGAEGGRD